MANSKPNTIHRDFEEASFIVDEGNWPVYFRGLGGASLQGVIGTNEAISKDPEGFISRYDKAVDAVRNPIQIEIQ